MKTKIGVSYYPKTSKKYKWFWKSMDISGICEVIDDDLIFTAKLAGFIRMKDWDFKIPLKKINEIEYVTLNFIMPIGLCIKLDNGKEYMLGCLKRKTLKQMIEMNIIK